MPRIFVTLLTMLRRYNYQREKKHVFLSFERRINPAALGYPLMAFISVHVQQQRLALLAKELADIPEILEGYGLTGSADLLLRVVALDAEDLFRINGKILACEGVDRTDTALAAAHFSHSH